MDVRNEKSYLALALQKGVKEVLLTFSNVNFQFSSCWQEVKGDVMGGVYPNCLVYPFIVVCISSCDIFS